MTTATITQVLPSPQVAIIREALCILGHTLRTLNPNDGDENISYKQFDVQTLIAMLNGTTVSINVPMDNFKRFSSINGIDFPIYVK